MNQTIRQHIQEQVAALPHSPGVYQFIDRNNTIIYVGKAKDLRKRVSSYFVENRDHSAKVIVLVRQIVDIRHIVVDSEQDALLLENSLIKKLQPRYNILLKDPTKPMLNRATQSSYPPGSTFKTVQALIGLQMGVITPHTQYACSGQRSTPIKCTHSHGSPVALEEAIEQSCNPYFWCLYRDMLHPSKNNNTDLFKQKYNEWRNYVLQFGFAQKFQNTDIGTQVSGGVPEQKFFDRIYGKKGWRALTIRSLSIGQGEIGATPLQLANQMAAIANGGYYITPHLNKHDSMQLHKHQIDIDAKYFDVVKKGMHRVMTNGTGRYYLIDGIEVAGKTGTAENPHGKDHAVFIGYAPLENPQIAIAVVVENAGFGATWAAPIASLMIEQYLTGEIKRKDLKNRIANAVINESVKIW